MLILLSGILSFRQAKSSVPKIFRLFLRKSTSHMAPSRSSSRSRSKVEPISIKSVDLLKQDNSPKHYTSEYEAEELVVRRGFPFTLMLTLSREVKENERVEFELRMGQRPMTYHGSLIKLTRVDPKPDEDVDGFNILASSGDVLTIRVFTSAKTTGIGKWLLVMRPYHGRRRMSLSKVTNDLVIIFNPWSKHDPVYMPNDSWRKEYVLNEDGMQFFGTTNRIGQMDWYFGQFEAPVMKACIKLLTMGYLRYRDHSSPVMVSRHLSGLVNSNDDNGVLVGNWSGDYDDGKSPTSWNGSVAILKQFVETGSPVKYGQCWVFSGVFTAVLRCLGIPARSLTTFESAHDTDGNLTIDYHYDENGKPMDNDDSVWNFHVWNDAWMARGMLPEGFGGWQAVDATPQEESGGKFQCGPASVSALKEGQINLDYDAPFVYAEVNGSKKYWQKLKKPERTEDGKLIEWEDVGSNTDVVGQHISTKALGALKREDITHKYKYPEGSREEELAFQHARKYVKFTKIPRPEVPKVVEFQPSIPDSVKFGSDISFKLKVKNISKSSQSVFVSVVGRTVQYNGSVVAKILDKDYAADIAASKTQEFELSLPAKTYLRHLKGSNNLKFSFLGGVQGSKQTFAAQDVLEFDKPSIKVEVVPPIKLLKSMKVKVSFANPLSVALDGGVFRFEGAGIKDAVIAPISKVEANGVAKAEVNVVPRKLGSRRIIVSFSSKQLDGVRGSIDIKVV